MSILGLGRNKHYVAGMKYFDHGQYELAIRELKSVLSDESGASEAERKLARFNLGEAHSALAEDHLQRQHWAVAEEELKRAIDINPNYPDLRYQLAKIYFFTERYTQSLEETGFALEINPRFAKAIYLDGLNKYKLGDRESGLRRIREAVALEPNYQSKDLEFAFAFDADGEFDQALERFSQIGDLCVDQVAEHIRAAKEQIRLGDYAEAERNIKEALTINPDYADLHNMMGQVWAAKSEYLRAVNEFKVALLINPNFVAAHLNLGDACRAMGNDDVAKTHYKQALTLDPECEAGRIGLSTLSKK